MLGHLKTFFEWLSKGFGGFLTGLGSALTGLTSEQFVGFCFVFLCFYSAYVVFFSGKNRNEIILDIGSGFLTFFGIVGGALNVTA